MHLSESRARKNNVLFHKLQAAGIYVVTESLFGFTKLILHHPRAVTAASRGSTIADLALRITHQPEPYSLWSRFTHTLPCLTLISTVWALVCATASPVRSPAKASAILNESVTAVTASRFSPVVKWWQNFVFGNDIHFDSSIKVILLAPHTKQPMYECIQLLGNVVETTVDRSAVEIPRDFVRSRRPCWITSSDTLLERYAILSIANTHSRGAYSTA